MANFDDEWLKKTLQKKGYGVAPGSRVLVVHVSDAKPNVPEVEQFGTVVYVEPMGKPRMTQSDKWKKRDCVVRYRAYADLLREKFPLRPKEPLDVSWTAYFTMPKSWSKKKKAEMAGKPHRQKPDLDNLEKGVFDALWEHDECIASCKSKKLWDDGRGARIEISVL